MLTGAVKLFFLLNNTQNWKKEFKCTGVPEKRISSAFFSFPNMSLFGRSLPTDFVRLDQDILTPLAGKKQLYTYETMDFWEQIKTPG